MKARPLSARLALALAVGGIAMPAGADGLPGLQGYDALWRSLPATLFAATDEKTLDDPQSFEHHAFRAWGAIAPEGGRMAAGQHRVEILGADLTIDHRVFRFARAKVFPGEVATEPGADTRLFVGARDVCVQGTAPSASGTAQRHVHVTLVTDAFTRQARRYDLPSLFGSCLALTPDAGAGLRFPEGRYHVAEGASASDGVDFRIWQLRDGRFASTPQALRVRFPDPENVYRFEVLAP